VTLHVAHDVSFEDCKSHLDQAPLLALEGHPVSKEDEVNIGVSAQGGDAFRQALDHNPGVP
jgi:hypothetical protein